MEFGNSESKDSVSGLISGCSEHGECLIYTESGNLVGRVAPGWGKGITYETRQDDIMSG